MSGETCSVCNWTNTACLNLGEPAKPKWMCHGCIKKSVDDLQSHKAALEKARVALWHVEKYLGFCSHPIVLTVKEALATINELLQKGSK